MVEDTERRNRSHVLTMKSITWILILTILWGLLSGLQPAQHSKSGKTDSRIQREILQKYKVREFNLKLLTDITGNSNRSEPGGAFYKIRHGDSLMGYLYTGRVNSCRKGGCSVPDYIDLAGDHEFFDYFVLFSPSKKVLQVVVHNYEATHGHEITAKGWLKQFTGYDGRKPLTAGKEIDAISGATISVQGIVEDISEKCALLQNMK